MVETLHTRAATSEFEAKTVYDVVGRLNSQLPGALYLPAIQRHFVWHMKQICSLFDSIMQAYPIGTFLFWEVEDSQRHHYAFYEFIRDYNEHAHHRDNRSAPRSLPRSLVGVLDGQQRLNSMYVALQGSYSAFIGGKGNKCSRLESFPRREFYLNLGFVPPDEERCQFEFLFLTNEEQQNRILSHRQAWFPVANVFQCTDESALEAEWDRYIDALPPQAKAGLNDSRGLEMIRLLRTRLHVEKLITYFPIRGRDLTSALQIFIRANNGGTRVSEPEMIFSTIVAHWQDGRSSIEALRQRLNEKGSGFDFSVSNLMLACLTLAGLPVRLRIESFRPAHVDVIRGQWAEICIRLLKAADCAVAWGLSGNPAIKPNFIIALAVMLHRGIWTKSADNAVRLFTLRCLLCDLFQRQEKPLTLLRELAHSGSDRGFNENDLRSVEERFRVEFGTRFLFSPEQLEELLSLHIGDNRVFLLLSLLHPHHDAHEHAFHKDHIHPYAKFHDLSAFKLSQEAQLRWHDWKNRLPNIQLLQGQVNMSKQDKAFKEWLEEEYLGDIRRGLYLVANDIPSETSLDFCNFETFYKERQNHLRTRLAQLLQVDITSPPKTATEKTEA